MYEQNFKSLAREMSGKQRSGSSILLLTIVTLVVLLIFWAAITELDNVTRGDGKTTSEAQNQMVQSSESGVIRARYVSDGEFVERGQVLFDIDPIDAKTQLDQAQSRYASLDIKSARLNAEVAGTLPKFTDDLIEMFPDAISTELALFNARLDDRDTKVKILEQRRLQKLNEREELDIQIETAQNTVNLLNREIATIEPLVKAGLAPETRLITLQREAETSIGQINSAVSGKKRINAGLEELKQELAGVLQLYTTNALTDLSAIKGEMGEIAARIPALKDRVERTSIKSPVDGVVNQLNYMTADAYVTTGDVLLELVPTGSEIIVEARIKPKDIAEISLGQSVKISLTAYDPSRYGRLDGQVTNISADAITDEQSGEQFYQVDVSIDGTLFEENGDPVRILPGMVASIDVLSGKRTVLEYFWQPIAKTKDRALRD